MLISKIIFFDVWTKGTHHYKDLQKILRKNDIEIILLHFGSYGDEIRNEMVSVVNGITCYDMKYFNYNIKKAILNFKPIAILYLSIDPLIMRACNLYAYKYKIKTFLTYPGLWSAQNYNNQKLLSKKSFYRYFIWIKNRIPNYLINYLPQYFLAVLNSKNKSIIIKSFLKIEFLKFMGNINPEESFDMRVKKVFVYNYFDKLHAKKKFPKSSIKIIGVPDLYRYGELKKYSKLSPLKRKINKKFLYIGSGQRSRGMLLNDPYKYYIYLCDVKKYLNNFHKDIIFKLHPSCLDDIKKINKKQKFKIDLITNSKFYQELQSIDCCITEPSSMSLIPIYLGINVFGTRMFELDKLNYGLSIKNYKLFRYLNEKEDLNKSLTKLNNIPKKMVIKSINKICGEEPPEEFSKRINKEIFF